MMIRRSPAMAGIFYPENSESLRGSIEKHFKRARIRKMNVIGLVTPHAGYNYCGDTAAFCYKCIANKFDTFVIIGPNHRGIGTGITTMSGFWETPLGTLQTDYDFVSELAKDSSIVDDYRPHLREHSVEVQLPWIQYRFGNVKFVPIIINPIYFDKQTSQALGEKIVEVSKRLNRKILVIASSDFTHYGDLYNNKPFTGTPKQVLSRIKKNDMGVVRSIEKLLPAKVIDICDRKRLSLCGYGAIATMLFAAKSLGAKRGELLDYSTSYETSKDIEAFVSYCGIAIY